MVVSTVKTNVCFMGKTMVLHSQVVNRITLEHSYRHNTYVTDTYIRLFNATTYIQIKKYHHIKRGQTIDVIMYKRLCYMLNAITAVCIVVFYTVVFDLCDNSRRTHVL